MSLSRDLTLYNGVSNRSRGWKSKRPDRAWPSHVSSNPTVMRWDGAARSSFAWDSLRRDPELWYRDGDCYVHLYGQGQSRRGPAFKVPLAVLLEADCYPLINRFIAQEVHSPPGAPSRRAAPARPGHPYGRTELYIPAPPGSDKQQAYQFHLATRNFFAFVFRRSLVGEHLGTALINLVETMQAFRPPQVDNFADLMSYMDEEGYLYFKCQPSHALAALHLAEVLHVRDLYIDAFAHCCGMSDQLFLGPEYQLLSSVTRKLLRRSRIEVELRLGQMGSMLKTFLQDELSEAHLGLQPGARAHLDRFRTLLYSVYASKFGFYPPASIDPRSTIFEIDVFRTMRADFDALFEYLVDTEVDPSQGIPIMAQGGICTLQSVQSFDTRYKFDTLSHPLPLLPETQSPLSAKRVSWFGKQVRSGVHQRTATHHALLRATNAGCTDLLDNDLVRAYRKFEEDTVFAPQRADKQENLHPADARKVRWILIYATYQCLRQATQPPPEVKDGANAPYHLCISTGNLPPWKDDRPVHSFQRKPTGDISRNPSISTAGWSGATEVWTPPRSPDIRLEIKPDIDYLAIAKRDSLTDLSMTGVGQQVPPPMRRGSTMRPNVSRNNPVRRSFTMFNRPNVEKLAVHPSRRSSHYHEIVIHGYGNGMNEVEFGAQQQQHQQQLQLQQQNQTLQRQPRLQQQLQLQAQPPPIKTEAALNTSRSPSTSSKSSESNDGTRSEQSTASTGATSLTESSTAAGAPTALKVAVNPCLSWDTRHAVGEPPQRGREREADPLGPRPVSIVVETTPLRWVSYQPPQLAASRQGLEKRRSQSMHAQYRKSMEPLPLNIRKAREDSDLGTIPQQHEETEEAAAATDDADLMLMMPVPTNPAALGDIKALMEVRASALGSPTSGDGDDIRPEWDMYGLGGLTEPKP